VDPVPDFEGNNLTMVKVVTPHVNDPNVKHLSWELYDPSDQLMPGSFSMLPGTPAATTAPFVLAGNMFSGGGFVPGKYLLRCVGRNASHQPIVYADRDFMVVSSDLATNVPLPTKYGVLTFTQYDKSDGTPGNPSYSVNVKLSFLPLGTVACNDVTFIQAVQSFDAQGRSNQQFASAEADARQTPAAWTIDRVAGAPSPFYIAGRDATGAVTDVPGWGQAGKGGPSAGAATLIDAPGWNKADNIKFESCVICRAGANRGQVYGCATWGYTATADGKVTLGPRSFRQIPSDQFEEARTAWNAWRTSLPAATQPEEAPPLRSP
jgi:hypothetical protein